MQLVTISRLRAHRSCARYHHIRYNLQIEPARDRDETRFGTLWHTALESWGLNIKSDDPVQAAMTSARNVWRMGHAPDPFELAALEALLEGYHLRWAAEPLSIVAVEAEFRAPLLNPDSGAASRTFQQGGKIDMVVATHAGAQWIVEHKSTTLDITPGSAYWKRLRLDGQISIYFDGATALGYAPVGCIYDVVKRPTQEPYKATPEASRKYTQGKKCRLCKGEGRRGVTSPYVCAVCNDNGWEEAPRLYANQRDRDETVDEYRDRVRAAIAADPAAYYQRGEVVRIDGELDEARRDVWRQARLIREGQVEAAHPRNPDACTKFGSTCEFFDVCTGEAELDDETRFRRAASAHPELSAA
jgi:PD-(D/E)XK nuclease superfamily protein